MNKKGYTLVEIIAVIALIAVICGLFVLNFSRKNNNQLEENYNNEIKKIESAADTYVMTNKSSSDSKYEIIKYTAANEGETFCYITLEDLVDDGFLNKIPINPKTNEEFEGVVKFTKLKDGAYDFKYTEDDDGYVLFVYERNGATSVGRHVQAVVCDGDTNNEIASCSKGITLPSIKRDNGIIYGWSTNKPAEMSGGSFTVTNLGSMGIESFTPVINPPQVAILGVCAITNRLKADGSVYPAMGLSLTFDHRAVDGSPAARFLKQLATALENFSLLLAK